MACSKYIITNTGSTIVNFNYQRCEDALWEYQVELFPNETKTIWLLNGTYSNAFSNSVSLINEGGFPPPLPSPTPTETPTQTPTQTQTQTQTPSQTPTQTQTPSQTPTQTPTQTQTQTQTNTPTPSNTPSETPANTPGETPTNTPSNSPTQTPSNTPGETPTNTPSNSPTQTPSNTPSETPANTPGETSTPTPSNTPSETPANTPGETSTPTPSNTPSETPANTPGETPTNTPSTTPTNTPTLSLQSFSVFSGITSNESCENGFAVTIYAIDPIYDQNTQFYTSVKGDIGYDMTGFYSDGSSVTELDSNGSQVGSFTLCSSLVTPTPTPTLTQTPTQTFAWYTYTLGSGVTTNDACDNFISSPITVYGTIAGGIGPNVGEYLYETSGRPLTDAVPDGYYSNGTAWYQVSGGLGQITSSDPNGCVGLPTQTPTPTTTVTPSA